MYSEVFGSRELCEVSGSVQKMRLLNIPAGHSLHVYEAS